MAYSSRYNTLLLYIATYLDTYAFFFFNDTATTEIYTLSLHDALPISPARRRERARGFQPRPAGASRLRPRPERSEEHTSELQSQSNLVCRLLLEKKKNNSIQTTLPHNPASPEHPSRVSNSADTPRLIH